MALTIGEAGAVNVILRTIYSIDNGPERDPGDVDDAARLLAQKANKTLGAGLSARDIDKAIARRDGGDPS